MWHSPKAVARLVSEHLARRPAMQVQDIYKLLYQAVRGPEHLVTVPAEFAARLRAEWEAVSADDSDPLLESIRPDGSLVRANLRTWKARGGDLDVLAKVCLQTVRYAWGTAEDLRQAWSAFVEICRADSAMPYSLSEVLAFSRWLEEQSYPVVHHSERYHTLYRPAYRLVRSL